MDKHLLKRFLSEYPAELADQNAAIFLGAGASMAAGYPSWSGLLKEIGEDLGVRSNDIQDLAALAQWSIREHGGATRVRSVIRKEIGILREIPESIRIVARLPFRHLWTTNYDRLIERAFEAIDRPLDVVSSSKDLAIKGHPGAARLYKMHGSVSRLDDLVISTDDYELYRATRGAFLPLLQAQMTGMSVLFLGLSFTDPNIRHVLSLIRESFTEAPPEHYAIVRAPQEADYDSIEEFKAKLAQHNHWAKDLQRYGLHALEIEDYEEVPTILREIERAVASKRVWISGSLPYSSSHQKSTFAIAMAEKVGQLIGSEGLSLVSGAGLMIGSASLSGFLTALRAGGGWDLERRLIARPFPQPLDGREPDREQWTALRNEMARLAGTVVFIAGVKTVDGRNVLADGVFEEERLAKEHGAFLLPIGSTGGAAKAIAQRLIGSELPSSGRLAQRPSDNTINKLMDDGTSPDEIIEIVRDVLLNRG